MGYRREEERGERAIDFICGSTLCIEDALFFYDHNSKCSRNDATHTLAAHV